MNQPPLTLAIQVDAGKMSGEPCIGANRGPVETLFRCGIADFKRHHPDIANDEIEAAVDATLAILKEHCRVDRQMEESHADTGVRR